jgi:hypothetical protein
VETYDPATDAWTAGAALPAARERLAAAALNGGVYVVGGMGSGQTDVLVAGAWKAGAPLSGARGALAAVTLAGSVWAIGGTGDGATSLGKLEVLKP